MRRMKWFVFAALVCMVGLQVPGASAGPVISDSSLFYYLSFDSIIDVPAKAVDVVIPDYGVNWHGTTTGKLLDGSGKGHYLTRFQWPTTDLTRTIAVSSYAVRGNSVLLQKLGTGYNFFWWDKVYEGIPAVASADTPGDKFSFAVWAKLASYPTSSQVLFNSDDNTGTPTTAIEMRGAQMRWKINGTTINKQWDCPWPSGFNTNDYQWHHYAGTYDGAAGVAELFIDGVSAGTLTAGLPSSLKRDWSFLTVGANGTPEKQVTGQLDDLYFFSRVLTGTEIATLADKSGLVTPTLYFSFDNLNTLATPISKPAPAPYPGNNSGITKPYPNYFDYAEYVTITEDANGYIGSGRQIARQDADHSPPDWHNTLDPNNILSLSTDGIFGGSLLNPLPSQFQAGGGNGYGNPNGIYVPTTSLVNVPTSELTVAFWVKLDAPNISVETRKRIFCAYPSQATAGENAYHNAIQLEWTTSGHLLELYGYDGTTRTLIYTSRNKTSFYNEIPDPLADVTGTGVNYITGRWVHYAFTYNASTGDVNFYRDGEKINTGTFPNSGGTIARDKAVNAINLPSDWNYGAVPGVCFIGITPDNVRVPIGKMDEFFVLNKALTQTQVQALATPPSNSPIPGDANIDGKVDVSDLGILAANYGATTGATWDKGDFSNDGKVDVSDLGILAANYGTGTGASLDFAADAKAAGLTVGEVATQKEDAVATTSSLGICGSAGLPLVIGLLLAAMWLGNFQLKK